MVAAISVPGVDGPKLLRRSADLVGGTGGRPERLALAFETAWRAFDDPILWPLDAGCEDLLASLFRYGRLEQTARRMTAAEAAQTGLAIRRCAEAAERRWRLGLTRVAAETVASRPPAAARLGGPSQRLRRLPR